MTFQEWFVRRHGPRLCASFGWSPIVFSEPASPPPCHCSHISLRYQGDVEQCQDCGRWHTLSADGDFEGNGYLAGAMAREPMPYQEILAAFEFAEQGMEVL
jgi:hypothetical protein